MKRAVFKIGRQILVDSHTRKEEFAVEIDVDEWERKPCWDLEFKYARKAKHPDDGTRIQVTEMNDGVGTQFNLQQFRTNLLDRISMAHSLFLTDRYAKKAQNFNG